MLYYLESKLFNDIMTAAREQEGKTDTVADLKTSITAYGMYFKVALSGKIERVALEPEEGTCFYTMSDTEVFVWDTDDTVLFLYESKLICITEDKDKVISMLNQWKKLCQFETDDLIIKELDISESDKAQYIGEMKHLVLYCLSALHRTTARCTSDLRKIEAEFGFCYYNTFGCGKQVVWKGGKFEYVE